MKTTTRHDRRMLRLMNDPRHRRLHATRARRRGLVAAHVALTAAVLAVLVPVAAPSADTGPRWAALAALLLLTAAWCVVTGALNLATRGLMELRARMLDERQRAERGRAFVLAHRTSLLLHLAALLWLLLAFGGEEAVSVRTLAGTVLVLLVAHWLLPLWAAALTARDEPADEPAEED
ncbi:hypothetical protein [Streptomyces radiopugnans]|uniref:Uncharacterized protein n=1 Tax=Streptomyces radiopugnans TaxID=403935 RepID=A0A1H9HTP1_9ACTN|nr:hypothetical protein [Streptomyces radiopugnans]SEQ65648.1 hypothetical protein SAMN05216481_11218 [Streptomyces radiopugnans]